LGIWVTSWANLSGASNVLVVFVHSLSEHDLPGDSVSGGIITQESDLQALPHGLSQTADTDLNCLPIS